MRGLLRYIRLRLNVSLLDALGAWPTISKVLSAPCIYQHFLVALRLSDVLSNEGYAGRKMVQNLLAECETNLGPYDGRSLLVRHCLMVHYLFKSDHVEAKKMGQDLAACYQQVQPREDLLHYQTQALSTVAECQYIHGEEDLAIANLEETIHLRVSASGRQDMAVRVWLVRLEYWYLEQGRPDSAAQVRDRREKLLELVDME